MLDFILLFVYPIPNKNNVKTNKKRSGCKERLNFQSQRTQEGLMSMICFSFLQVRISMKRADFRTLQDKIPVSMKLKIDPEDNIVVSFLLIPSSRNRHRKQV